MAFHKRIVSCCISLLLFSNFTSALDRISFEKVSSASSRSLIVGVEPGVLILPSFDLVRSLQNSLQIHLPLYCQNQHNCPLMSSPNSSSLAMIVALLFTPISIHSKSGCPGCPDSAESSNFPQKGCLRTRKLSVLLPES